MPYKDPQKQREFQRRWAEQHRKKGIEPIEHRRRRLKKQRQYKKLQDLTKGDTDGTKIGTFTIDPKTLGYHTDDPTICPVCITEQEPKEYLDNWIQRNGVCLPCYSRIYVERSAKYLGLATHLKQCHETKLAELKKDRAEGTPLYTTEVYNNDLWE